MVVTSLSFQKMIPDTLLKRIHSTINLMTSLLNVKFYKIRFKRLFKQQLMKKQDKKRLLENRKKQMMLLNLRLNKIKKQQMLLHKRQ